MKRVAHGEPKPPHISFLFSSPVSLGFLCPLVYNLHGILTRGNCVLREGEIILCKRGNVHLKNKLLKHVDEKIIS